MSCLRSGTSAESFLTKVFVTSQYWIECTECNAKCSDFSVVMQHIEGKEHKRKMGWRFPGYIPYESGEAPTGPNLAHLQPRPQPPAPGPGAAPPPAQESGFDTGSRSYDELVKVTVPHRNYMKHVKQGTFTYLKCMLCDKLLDADSMETQHVVRDCGDWPSRPSAAASSGRVQ